MIGALPARVANMRRLIRALDHEMTGKCIAEFHGMSESGARKYIHDLAPVIHLVRRIDVGPKSIGQPVYRLTSDTEALERFMFALDATVAPPTPRKKPVKAVDVTRHVHIRPDDETVMVKHRRLPKVDSYALPAEFFRAGQV